MLTGFPEKKEDWLGMVREIMEQTERQDGAPMITLLSAVEKLLRGDPAASIQPALSGPHADCWARIVAGLAGK